MILLISINVFSQKIKPKFVSINQFGLVTGNNQSVFTMQSINGIGYKTWVHGLGLAIDNYGSQSSPIFLNSSTTIGSKKMLFVYAQVGVNIPWRTSNFPEKWSDGMDAYKLHITPYTEAGFGIKKSIGNGLKFIASLGYSYKQFGYTEQNSWNFWTPTGPTRKDVRYDFYYRRLAFRMGFEF